MMMVVEEGPEEVGGGGEWREGTCVACWEAGSMMAAAGRLWCVCVYVSSCVCVFPLNPLISRMFLKFPCMFVFSLFSK